MYAKVPSVYFCVKWCEKGTLSFGSSGFLWNKRCHSPVPTGTGTIFEISMCFYLFLLIFVLEPPGNLSRCQCPYGRPCWPSVCHLAWRQQPEGPRLRRHVLRDPDLDKKVKKAFCFRFPLIFFEKNLEITRIVCIFASRNKYWYNYVRNRVTQEAHYGSICERTSWSAGSCSYRQFESVGKRKCSSFRKGVAKVQCSLEITKNI